MSDPTINKAFEKNQSKKNETPILQFQPIVEPKASSGNSILKFKHGKWVEDVPLNYNTKASFKLVSGERRVNKSNEVKLEVDERVKSGQGKPSFKVKLDKKGKDDEKEAKDGKKSAKKNSTDFDSNIIAPNQIYKYNYYKNQTNSDSSYVSTAQANSDNSYAYATQANIDNSYAYVAQNQSNAVYSNSSQLNNSNTPYLSDQNYNNPYLPYLTHHVTVQPIDQNYPSNDPFEDISQHTNFEDDQESYTRVVTKLDRVENVITKMFGARFLINEVNNKKSKRVIQYEKFEIDESEKIRLAIRQVAIKSLAINVKAALINSPFISKGYQNFRENIVQLFKSYHDDRTLFVHHPSIQNILSIQMLDNINSDPMSAGIFAISLNIMHKLTTDDPLPIEQNPGYKRIQLLLGNISNMDASRRISTYLIKALVEGEDNHVHEARLSIGNAIKIGQAEGFNSIYVQDNPIPGNKKGEKRELKKDWLTRQELWMFCIALDQTISALMQMPPQVDDSQFFPFHHKKNINLLQSMSLPPEPAQDLEREKFILKLNRVYAMQNMIQLCTSRLELKNNKLNIFQFIEQLRNLNLHMKYYSAVQHPILMACKASGKVPNQSEPWHIIDTLFPNKGGVTILQHSIFVLSSLSLCQALENHISQLDPLHSQLQGFKVDLYSMQIDTNIQLESLYLMAIYYDTLCLRVSPLFSAIFSTNNMPFCLPQFFDLIAYVKSHPAFQPYGSRIAEFAIRKLLLKIQVGKVQEGYANEVNSTKRLMS